MSHPAHPRSSPFPTQPLTSQATLVSSTSPGRPGPSSQTAPHDMQALLNEQSFHINPPRVRRMRNASGPINQSPPPIAERRVAPRPARRPVLTKKLRPVPSGLTSTAPIIPSTEAPYHNTRSRSRSVEPSMPTRAAPSKKTQSKKDQEPSPPRLEPLEEVQGEDTETLDIQEADQQEISAPTGETLEEELDVEELLVANATDLSGVSRYQDGVDNTPQKSIHNHISPLSTDDQETSRTLRQVRELPRSQFPTSNITLDDPEDILKRFADARSASSRLSSVRPPFNARNNVARPRASGAAAVPRVSQLSAELSTQPTTPVRSRSPARKHSTSSAESFPLIGTRASAMKRKIQEEEKHSPYTPPPGTRAAQLRRR
jgi:hypothetical protein